MRLTTPFTALRNATSDILRMHDFNYQLSKDQRQDYWEKNVTITQQVLIVNFTKGIINLKIKKTLLRVFSSK